MGKTSPSSPLGLQTGPDWAGFWIHVTPGARRAGILGCHGDALRIAVQAPPVAGKANRACADLLATALGVAPGAVSLDPGARGRRKRVRVEGDPGRLSARLHSLASSARLG
ncbi:MAG: DUF167 domain-containing protein [Myxococcota bacterium]|nr:DUF167 domain-containing protein [Myxococcota bacterium]